jgi:phage gpG-like protein
MTTFTIKVDDAAVRAKLAELAQKFDNLQPILQDIGEGIVERAEARFQTSTGPDGQRWAPNSAATLMALVGATRKVEANVGKGGDLNARGLRAVGSKKPLIGLTGIQGSLRTSLNPTATRSELTVSSSAAYAAIQQFGGKKSQFPNLWGDIPARPFLPVRADGTLYPADQAQVMDLLNAYFEER